MRTLIGSLTVLLFVCVAWFVFGEDSQPDQIAGFEDQSAREQEVVRTELAAGTAKRGEAGREPVVEKRLAKVRAAERVTITGSVVLLDAEDKRHEKESGSLRVTHTDEALGEVEVAVTEGHFSFETDFNAVFLIGGVKLRSLECSLDKPQRDVRAHPETKIDLEVHQALPATLIVRDRVTRQDLTGLTVWSTPGWSLEGLDSPPAGTLELTLFEQSSPIVLPARGGHWTWWVRAEGYLCEQVLFDHRNGGELLVFLDREASVVVTLEGEGREGVEQVSVERIPIPRQFEVQDATLVPLHFGGLKSGVFVVRALSRADKGQGRAIAIAEVELRAGGTAEVTLNVPAQVERKRVPVRGTLDLPSEARGLFHSLAWRRTDEGGVEETVDVSWPFSPVEGSATLLEWSTERLSPGAWEVEVQPFGHYESVVIGDSGSNGVVLRVPALAEVLVEVRTADTGEALPLAKVSWSLRDGSRSRSGRIVEEAEEPGVFRFFTTPGEVWISARSDGRAFSRHARASQTVGVHTGVQRIVFELHKSRRVSFQLKAGLTILKRDQVWWQACQVERLDGAGEVSARSYGQDFAGTSVWLSAPGLYRFTFAKLDGYLAIEPIELLIEEPHQRIEIQLIRE